MSLVFPRCEKIISSVGNCVLSDSTGWSILIPPEQSVGVFEKRSKGSGADEPMSR